MDSENQPALEEPVAVSGVEARADAPSTPPSRGAADTVSHPDRASDDPAVPPSGPRPAIAVPLPVTSRSRIRAVAGYLLENRADIVNLVSLGALAVTVFLLRLELIGIGGDAIRKWHFVRQWFYKNDFSAAKWDHHMARLGVNGVAYLAQLLFGRGPRVYYVAPVSAGVLQVLFVYACGKRLGGRLAGSLAALLLIVFPPEQIAASQLLPEVFSGTYAIIAMYFLLRYADAEPTRRTRWLLATAVTVFVDYLAKETSVFFMPGMVVAIWMVAPQRRVRDLAIFLGVFAVGVGFETAFYHHFTNYAHRFAIVETTHTADGGLDSSETDFWGLFNRFEEADPAWRFLFYSFTASSLGVLAFAKNVRASAVVVITLSYYFFLTFLVRHINPIIIWQSFRSRYLDPTAPFVILVTGLFLATVLSEIFRQNASARARLIGAFLGRHGSACLVACSTLMGLGYYWHARPHLAENPLVTIPEMARLVNDTYRRNFPLVSARDPNALWAAYSTLLDDRLLARKGVLPTFQDAKEEGERRTFVMKDSSVLTGDTLKRLLKKHCFMEAVSKDGHFFIRRMKTIAKECDAELSR